MFKIQIKRMATLEAQKIYLQIKDGKDDLKKIQNGSYFHYSPPRGMNAKKYREKPLTFKKLKKK